MCGCPEWVIVFMGEKIHDATIDPLITERNEVLCALCGEFKEEAFFEHRETEQHQRAIKLINGGEIKNLYSTYWRNPQMFGDNLRLNENKILGRIICEPCEGTGNAMLSMYQKCKGCDGKGYLDKSESEGA